MVHIALEGIDGCGKSTQAAMILEYLSTRNISYKFYRYTKKKRLTGRIIDRIFSQNSRSLFRRSRIVQEILYSILARRNLSAVGKLDCEVLLSDRSIASAYVAHPRMWWFVSLLECKRLPNHILLYDIDERYSLQRIKNREIKTNDENLHKAGEMRRLYLDMASGVNCPGLLKECGWSLIDASRLPEEVFFQTKKFLDAIIEDSV